ncbi:hypothetical protein P3339_13840 [Microbulbifer sp. MLAF003]|uniref:hypothetical protein n=1 Tax=Microbulbifer sp. MLAF003 TaxID=3032582 RepID=UPI0024AD85E2|nr:hypothetical protein [Microbulbifer sp. MLAF003]WHI49551.1 hypothetical protein P3339_13840 [Microbulbifer sp. MLAF003]
MVLMVLAFYIVGDFREGDSRVKGTITNQVSIEERGLGESVEPKFSSHEDPPVEVENRELSVDLQTDVVVGGKGRSMVNGVPVDSIRQEIQKRDASITRTIEVKNNDPLLGYKVNKIPESEQ